MSVGPKEYYMESSRHLEALDLSSLHENLTQSLAIVNRLRARNDTTDSAAGGADVSKFRRYEGGPLSDLGVSTMADMFQRGCGDSEIALSMSVSLAGVSRRRTMWRRERNATGK